MEISDQIKRYLLVYGIVFLGIFMLYYDSKHQFTCDKWANNFKDKEEFHLVLTGKNNTGRDAYLDGKDLRNKKQIEYHEDSGWIEDCIDTFRVGDTLIKDIGKYCIIIKRKGKTISIPFSCDGKIYK
jgi:hypothetical protein